MVHIYHHLQITSSNNVSYKLGVSEYLLSRAKDWLTSFLLSFLLPPSLTMYSFVHQVFAEPFPRASAGGVLLKTMICCPQEAQFQLDKQEIKI